MHSIALVNQKGGVGKSTTAVNLSAGLAKLGRRVLLIDLDPQAHSTVALGLQPKKLGATIYSLLSGAASVKEVIRPLSPGLAIIPSTINLAGGEAELTWQQNPHFILKKAMSELPETDFDFVIVDSPPQLGFLNVNSLAWVKNVFIPLTCEFYALHGLSLLVETVERIQSKLNPMLQISGVIACQYNARRALTKDVLADLEGHFPGKVMKSRIRVNVRLAEAPSHGVSIHDYAPGSSGSKDYMNLAREILERFPAEASPEVEAELAAIAAAKAQARGLAWTESPEPVAPTWSADAGAAPEAAPVAEAVTEAATAPPVAETESVAEVPVQASPVIEAAPGSTALPAAETEPVSAMPAQLAPEPVLSAESATAEPAPAIAPELEAAVSQAVASEPAPAAAETASAAAEVPAPVQPAAALSASPETAQAPVAPAPEAVPVDAVPAAAVAASATAEAEALIAPAPTTGHAAVDPLADLMAPVAPPSAGAPAVEAELEVTMPEPADHGRVIEPSSPMIISAEELAAAIPPVVEASVEIPPTPAPEAAPEEVAAAGDDPAARLGFDPYAESSPHLEAQAKPAESAAEFVSPLPATPVSELRAAIQSDAPVPASPESTVKPVPTLPSVKAASMPFSTRIAMAGLKPIVTSKPGTPPPAPEKKGLLGKLMPWRK